MDGENVDNMEARDWACWLAERFGIKTFPLTPHGSTPTKGSRPYKQHTSDPDAIEQWPGHFNDNYAVSPDDRFVILDVDDKEGKGQQSLEDMQERFGPLPRTLTVATPSGGLHLYYEIPTAFRNARSEPGAPNIIGTDTKFFPAIDVRGYHGYVVGVGSFRRSVTGKPDGGYTLVVDASIAAMPEALYKFILDCSDKPATTSEPVVHKDNDASDVVRYIERMSAYEPAIQGKGGDHQTYVVACAGAEQGLTADVTLALMLEFYNPRCEPPWDNSELRRKVDNAYQYMQSPKGARSLTRDQVADELTQAEEVPGREEWVGGILQPLSQVEAERVYYLWSGYFPKASLSLLAAPGGSGKTTFMMALAAAVSRGRPFGGHPVPKGTVIVASAEDDPGTLLVPRLKAADADLTRIHALKLHDLHSEGSRARMIEVFATLESVDLLIVDPITSYLDKGASGNSDSDVRQSLAIFQRLAEVFGTAVVLVGHTRKGTESPETRDRLLGSVAFVNTPRQVNMLIPDVEADDQAILGCIKTNLEQPKEVRVSRRLTTITYADGSVGEEVVMDVDCGYVGPDIEDFVQQQDMVKVQRKAAQRVTTANSKAQALAWVRDEAIICGRRLFRWGDIGNAYSVLTDVVFSLTQAIEARDSLVKSGELLTCEAEDPLSGQMVPLYVYRFDDLEALETLARPSAFKNSELVRIAPGRGEVGPRIQSWLLQYLKEYDHVWYTIREAYGEQELGSIESLKRVIKTMHKAGDLVLELDDGTEVTDTIHFNNTLMIGRP